MRMKSSSISKITIISCVLGKFLALLRQDLPSGVKYCPLVSERLGDRCSVETSPEINLGRSIFRVLRTE